MTKATAIDHICIAVKNLSAARKIYEERLGLELAVEYVDENEKIHVARYDLCGVALELMESTSPDGEVARFIEKRGEGLFLISYRVPDVEAALAEYHARGERTIDRKPREFRGHRYAFLHPPGDFCGVLTEIFEGKYEPEA